MRFPLRLTADLVLGLAMRSLGGKRPLISILSAGGNQFGAASPIVWIGGPEPLELPETPCVVNALAAAGRHVFLPTTGILLRRRIHELQPSARLHLTIRFDGADASHDERAGRTGAFRDALESVRTAKLSGFLLCAQLILHEPSDVAELEGLHEELRKIDFDGFLISPMPVASEDLRSGSAALRWKLLSRRWALFSTLLDSVVSPHAAAITGASHGSSSLAHHAVQLSPRSCEENVQAP